MQGGADVAKNIITAVNDGIKRGVASLGIEYATQAANLSPVLSSLTARAVTGAIEGALGGNIFAGVYKAFSTSALNISRLGISSDDPLAQAQYLQRVVNFSDIIKQKGLAQAIEDAASQVMTEDSITSILKSFNTVGAYVQDQIAMSKMESVTISGVAYKKLNLSNGDYELFSADYTTLVEVRKGDQLLRGTFGKDQAGNWGLLTGTVTQYDSQGKILHKDYYENGWNVEDMGGFDANGEYLLTIKPTIKDGPILFDTNGHMNHMVVEETTNLSNILSSEQIIAMSQKLGLTVDVLKTQQLIISADTDNGLSMSLSLGGSSTASSATLRDILGDLGVIISGYNPISHMNVTKTSLDFRRLLLVSEAFTTSVIANFYNQGLFQLAAEQALKLASSDAVKSGISFAKNAFVAILKDEVNSINNDGYAARKDFATSLGSFLDLFEADVVKHVSDQKIADEVISGYQTALSDVIDGFRESESYRQSLGGMNSSQKVMYNILAAFYDVDKASIDQ